MNKKDFVLPLVFLSGGLSGGEGDDVGGGGSAQGGTGLTPISYQDWLNSDWKEDIIQDGTINEDDYAAWWEALGFSQDVWEELNPGLSWEDYFG